VRSLGVVLFIVVVASIALFCVRRTTMADGARLGIAIAHSNEHIRDVSCDKNIPVGMTGATFECHIYMRDGADAPYKFRMDRSGKIYPVTQEATPRVKKTTDPWGD
jgi:hypothetical protein